MKLNEALELLTESIILPTKQAPDWVKNVLKEKGWGLQTIKVEVTEKPNLHKYADHDVMNMYFFVNGQVKEKNIETMEQVVAMNRGTETRLYDTMGAGTPNMLLVTHTPPHAAILYAHPNQMPKQIENKNSDLSDDEKKMLLITKGYISSYRAEYFKRYKINTKLQEIKESLIKKGLMTAAGALNTAGKNEVEKLRDANGINALEKLFGYGD